MLHPEKEVQQVRVVGWVAPGRVWAMISRSLALKGSRRSVAQRAHRAAAAVGCLEGILAVDRAWVVVLEGVVVPAVWAASAVVGVVALGERWVSGPVVVHPEKKDLFDSMICWRHFVAAVVVGHREGRLVAGPGSDLPQAVGHCEGKRPCRRGHWAAVGQEES